MRIALISPTYLPFVGGVELTVHHLARQWVLQGHEVQVLNAVTDRRPEPDCGYAVERFRIPRGSTRFGYHRFPFSIAVTRQFRRFIQRFRPEVISAHYGYPTAIWLSRLDPVPRFLITCHGRDITKEPTGYRRLYRIDRLLAQALNRAGAVIAISSSARVLLEDMGVEAHRIRTIPNGVDVAAIRCSTSWNLRQELGVPQGRQVVLSVGRAHPDKGYESGLRAFAAALDRLGDAQYVIVGRGSDGLAGLIDELGVGSRVSLSGGLYGPQLAAAYQQADVYFSPSRSELCSLALLEATVAGLPAVATRTGGAEDLIRPGVHGLLVKPGDEAAMGNALVELCREPELRRAIGRANFERGPDFDWQLVSRRYLNQQTPP